MGPITIEPLSGRHAEAFGQMVRDLGSTWTASVPHAFEPLLAKNQSVRPDMMSFAVIH